MGRVAQALSDLHAKRIQHIKMIERLMTRNAQLLALVEASRGGVADITAETERSLQCSLHELYHPDPVPKRVIAEVTGQRLCACSELLAELHGLVRDRFEWHERTYMANQLRAREAEIEELQLKLLTPVENLELDQPAARLSQLLEHLGILERSLAFERQINGRTQADFSEIHK